MFRWLLLSSLLPGCGLRDYVPQGPVLSERAFERWMDGLADPPRYTGEPRLEGPVIPFQLFALRYAEDIVIETVHPHWTMHEYARIEAGGREVWIAKDSDGDGVQTVTADLEGLRSWLPEVPVPRHRSQVEVDDRSSDERLDVTLRYRNPIGEQVEVAFSAARGGRLERKRNGSTFNHSQQVASVVLDIPRKQLGGTCAEVSFDGRPARIRRVLGLVPVKALLEQTQAGFAAASMELEPAEGGGLNVVRPIPGTPWATASRERWTCTELPHGGQFLDYQDEVALRRYAFEDGGLISAGIYELGADEPFVVLHLSQALPDLTRPFEGEECRRFALQLNGQLSGRGTLVARWEGADEVLVSIRPEAPAWFASRPMESRIRYRDDGRVELVSARVER